MKNIQLLALLLTILVNVNAQKHDNTWLLDYESNPPIIGNNFGLTHINFTSGSLLINGIIDDGSNFSHTNATLSNEEGNLLFYTNGLRILNSNSQVVENGEKLDSTLIENVNELHYLSTDAAQQGCLFLRKSI